VCVFVPRTPIIQYIFFCVMMCLSFFVVESEESSTSRAAGHSKTLARTQSKEKKISSSSHERHNTAGIKI
jgi:hypothetical protein